MLITHQKPIRVTPIPLILKVLICRFGSLERMFRILSVDDDDHWLLQAMCSSVVEAADARRCYVAAAIGHHQFSMNALSKKHISLLHPKTRNDIIVEMYRLDCPPCRRMPVFRTIPSWVLFKALRKSLYFSMPLGKSLTDIVDRLDKRDIDTLPMYLRHRLFMRALQECTKRTLVNLQHTCHVQGVML